MNFEEIGMYLDRAIIEAKELVNAKDERDTPAFSIFKFLFCAIICARRSEGDIITEEDLQELLDVIWHYVHKEIVLPKQHDEKP